MRQSCNSSACGFTITESGLIKSALQRGRILSQPLRVLTDSAASAKPWAERLKLQSKIWFKIFIFNYQFLPDHDIGDTSYTETRHMTGKESTNFKKINDTLRCPTGDRALRRIAKGLSGIAQESDIVGRVGGDEFVFFTKLENTTDHAKHVAQKICGAIKSIRLTDCSTETVTGNVSIALASVDGQYYETLVAKADQGVYLRLAEQP